MLFLGVTCRYDVLGCSVTIWCGIRGARILMVGRPLHMHRKCKVVGIVDCSQTAMPLQLAKSADVG
jgi:hypothetical protein